MLGSLSNLKEKKDFNDITSTSKLWIAQSCERDQVPVSSKFNDVLTILCTCMLRSALDLQLYVLELIQCMWEYF